MKKYIYTTEVDIEAENKEDADIFILDKMDAHDIYWKVEEEEQ